MFYKKSLLTAFHGWRMRRLLLSCWLLLIPLWAFALPLQTAILSPSEEEVGTALIYIDYVELLDPSKKKMGKSR